MSFRTVLSDPMLRMLVTAIALAALLPATGDARGVAQAVANAAIFVLFLLNGMRIARGDIVAGLANWRFLLPLILWVFGAMAVIGLALSSLASAWLAPSVALGFLYLGVLPSTVQSATSYSSLAGGNVALSVVAAALLACRHAGSSQKASEGIISGSSPRHAEANAQGRADALTGHSPRAFRCSARARTIGTRAPWSSRSPAGRRRAAGRRG